MIVKPTVNELLEHAENRFALVIATSKRAREIANGYRKPGVRHREEKKINTINSRRNNKNKY